MFDVSKSKLYASIMENIARIFGMDAQSATEAEIHEAVSNAAPISEQIAGTELAGKVEELTNRLNTVEQEQATLRSEIEQRDQRIAELQTQVATLETQASEKQSEIDSLKTQHANEVRTLAGQVASLKAGSSLDKEDADSNHAVNSLKKTEASGPITIQSKRLQEMLSGAKN